jgi:hypothetical protein
MSPSPADASRNSQHHWGTRILFGLLAVLGGAAVVLVATLLFGLNTGEEFSPNTFSRRTFYYYEIPLLGIQVTPIVRDDQTNRFERYLRQKGLVKAGNQGETRWDLVQAARSGKTTFHGDADILCSYLDAVDAEGDRYWQTWSEQNPKLAGILWPLVARMAERQLYIFVPELIDLASSVSQPDELQKKLNDSLAKQYWRLAKIQQEQGDHETAVELLTRSLDYVPGDRAVLECRKRSLQALEERSTAQSK